MKTFSDFKRNLTAKQAYNYSLIVSSVLALILAVLLSISLWPIFEVRGIIGGVLLALMAFIGFYSFFYYLVFNGDNKRWSEKHASAKQRVINNLNLNTETRVRVKYNFKKMLENVSDQEMLARLLEIPEYRFYLKLTGNENVELIVTDKYNYIVSVDTITNFVYIETYFEKID